MTKWALRQLSEHSAWHADRECPLLAKSDKQPMAVSDGAIKWHDLNDCHMCVGDNTSTYAPPAITEPDTELPDIDADALDTARREARRIADSFDHDPFAGAAERGGFVRGESNES